MKRLILLLITVATLSAVTPALAGWWSLMAPPTKAETSWWCLGYDTHPESHTAFCKELDTWPHWQAPLSKWQVLDPYERLTDCENAHNHYMAIALQHPDPETHGWVEHQKCVATDDPRLKP
jgi:hypothetical protein